MCITIVVVITLTVNICDNNSEIVYFDTCCSSFRHVIGTMAIVRGGASTILRWPLVTKNSYENYTFVCERERVFAIFFTLQFAIINTCCFAHAIIVFLCICVPTCSREEVPKKKRSFKVSKQNTIVDLFYFYYINFIINTNVSTDFSLLFIFELS